MECNITNSVICCIKVLVLFSSYVGVVMRSSVRRSCIYPDSYTVLNDTPHMWATFSCTNFCQVPDPDFAYRLLYTLHIIACPWLYLTLCPLTFIRHRPLSLAVCFQWTSDTNRTTHVHRRAVQTVLWVVQMLCVMLCCYGWFQVRFKTCCMYSHVREGSNTLILQAEGKLVLLWGRGVDRAITKYFCK
jgi:hypothetical protein